MKLDRVVFAVAALIGVVAASSGCGVGEVPPSDAGPSDAIPDATALTAERPAPPRSTSAEPRPAAAPPAARAQR